MKKNIMILTLALLCSFVSISATTQSNYLPGGKNYFDPNNFTLDAENEEIFSNDLIRIKPNTVYTFSFPGINLIYNNELQIYNSATYIIGSVDSNSNCVVSDEITYCTFTTSSNEEYINIQMSASNLTQYYSFYNGLPNFQLEEGGSYTAYEEYVPQFFDSTNPEFQGSGAYIVSYLDNIILSDIISNHIIAVDDIDGDISDSISIVSDAYSSNIGIVGEYLVELEVEDSSLNKAIFNLTVIIKDELIPTINGPDTVAVDINNQVTLDSIIHSNYVGFDEYDGDIILEIVKDTYTENISKVGTYEIIISATDSSSNVSHKTFAIEVNDYDMPIIESSNSFVSRLSNVRTLETIIGDLSYSDNYSTNENISLTIIIDNYSINQNIIGIYDVVINLEDESGNTNQVTLYIEVEDDIAPTISGPETMTISYTKEYSLTEIIGLYVVEDNYDNLTTNDLIIASNNYSQRNELIGNFLIEFTVIDNSGNITSHNLEILVIDDQSPVIYIDSYVISVQVNSTFSSNDALVMLVNNGELKSGNYTTKTLLNDYEGNEDNPGSYDYKLLVIDEEGNEHIKDLIVKVIDNENVFDGDYLVRNIIVYSAMLITIVGFVLIKKK